MFSKCETGDWMTLTYPVWDNSVPICMEILTWLCYCYLGHVWLLYAMGRSRLIIRCLIKRVQISCSFHRKQSDWRLTLSRAIATTVWTQLSIITYCIRVYTTPLARRQKQWNIPYLFIFEFHAVLRKHSTYTTTTGVMAGWCNTPRPQNDVSDWVLGISY